MGNYLEVRNCCLLWLVQIVLGIIFLILCPQVTSGDLRNDLKQEWDVEEVAKLLCTNNPAERPFAVAKAFLNLYGRMKLSTLANFTLSVCNGSHRLSEPKGKTKKTQHRSTCQGIFSQHYRTEMSQKMLPLSGLHLF